jgi:hypothetical protein
MCVSDRTLCVLMSWPTAADVRDSDHHLFAAITLFRSAQYSGKQRQEAEGDIVQWQGAKPIFIFRA